MWAHVAYALAFTIWTVHTPHPLYNDNMRSFFPAVWSFSRRPLLDVDIVFADQQTMEALCGSRSTDWSALTAPFIFTVVSNAELAPPSGWIFFKKSDIRHYQVGGSTTGVYSLGVLARESLLCAPGTLPEMITPMHKSYPSYLRCHRG